MTKTTRGNGASKLRVGFTGPGYPSHPLADSRLTEAETIALRLLPTRKKRVLKPVSLPKLKCVEGK